MLHEPRKRTPSASRASRAASERRGSKRASGRSSMSTSVTSCARRASRRSRCRSGRRRRRRPAGPERQLPGASQTRAGGVLLGLLEARDREVAGTGDRSPRRASAPRAERRASARRADNESTAAEVAGGDDSVDVLDPSLLELRCVGEQRQRDRSGASASRGAAGRAAGRARSSSRARPARRAGRRTHSPRRRCRRQRRTSSWSKQSEAGGSPRR